MAYDEKAVRDILIDGYDQLNDEASLESDLRGLVRSDPVERLSEQLGGISNNARETMLRRFIRVRSYASNLNAEKFADIAIPIVKNISLERGLRRQGAAMINKQDVRFGFSACGSNPGGDPVG